MGRQEVKFGLAKQIGSDPAPAPDYKDLEKMHQCPLGCGMKENHGHYLLFQSKVQKKVIICANKMDYLC